MEVLSTSTQETKELAESLATKLQPGSVLALYGDLGSGKTTFTGYLTHALGIEKRVQSPTFVILREYSGGNGKIPKVNHFDLYRLQTVEEVEDLGFVEILQESDALAIIEWPELAEELLPKDTVRIYFEYIDDETRKITIQNLD